MTVRSGNFGCITCLVMYVSGYLSSYTPNIASLNCSTILSDVRRAHALHRLFCDCAVLIPETKFSVGTQPRIKTTSSSHPLYHFTGARGKVDAGLSVAYHTIPRTKMPRSFSTPSLLLLALYLRTAIATSPLNVRASQLASNTSQSNSVSPNSSGISPVSFADDG